MGRRVRKRHAWADQWASPSGRTKKIVQENTKKRNEEIAGQRKTMVKTGDRSDKIRTYNYPQGRVTDHRIGLTLYSLNEIVNGDISKLIDELKLAENAEKLKNG